MHTPTHTYTHIHTHAHIYTPTHVYSPTHAHTPPHSHRVSLLMTVMCFCLEGRRSTATSSPRTRMWRATTARTLRPDWVRRGSILHEMLTKSHLCGVLFIVLRCCYNTSFVSCFVTWTADKWSALWILVKNWESSYPATNCGENCTPLCQVYNGCQYVVIHGSTRASVKQDVKWSETAK